MTSTPLEKQVQLSICQYLELKKYFFWRQNTIGVFDPVSKSFRSMPKYARKGVPDIIVILKNGQFLGIECKRQGSTQSMQQKHFEITCREHNARYILATSVDDVIKAGL